MRHYEQLDSILSCADDYNILNQPDKHYNIPSIVAFRYCIYTRTHMAFNVLNIN